MGKVSNKPIRVLQIGMHDKIGGVETFLMNYYRNIDRNKVQFDFINPYNKLCFQDEIISPGGVVYNVSNFKKHPIKYYRELKKIIFDGKYNIVHINMLSAANILPILAAKKCGVKNIITHSHNSNTPSNILKRIMDKINKRFVINNSSYYFGCSLKAANWLYDNKVTTDKITIINNAINIDKFSPNKIVRDRIRKYLGLKNELLIGHVGRFSYQKNHDFLIDVFDEIIKIKDDCKLLLIGDGELRDTILNKIKNLGIDNKVIYIGNVTNVNEYMQAMDLFLLPSRFEGLPVVGIEAQVSGLKCIFSDNITKEVDISDNCLFLKNELIPKIWAKEIIEFQNKKSSMKKIKNKNYDIYMSAKKLEEKYIKMLDN